MEQDFRRFAGSVALVTGAGSGIGRATALQMAREGARVAVVDNDRETGLQTLELLQKEGGQGVFLFADVSQSADVQGVIARVVELWGRLDTLVNNAGTMRFGPVTQLSEDDWDTVLAVNLRSAFLFCKYAVPHMKRPGERRGGAIVNVSSVHAQATTRNVAAYAASKGGLEAFTRTLALEVETQSIRVNAVAPGAVDTPLLWSNPNLQSGAEKLEGTVISAQGVAAAICYLASDSAAFITGTVLNVDAGRLARL